MSKKKNESTALTGCIKPSNWVQKADPLILMRSVPFTLNELKILDTYISRINAGDDTQHTVIFTKAEYEKLMGLTSADRQALRKNTKNMLTKVVELLMPNDEYKQFLLFEEAEYCKNEYGEPVIKLTCTNRAKEIFFCIGKYHYFKYALENIIRLTHKSSYLLYIYIVANRFREEWTVELDELRDTVLDCKGQGSYLAFKEFKRSVLDPAVKELNEKTDCHFVYEAIKRGRKVAKIKFIYHNPNGSEWQTSFFDEPLDVPLLSDQSEDDERWVKLYGSEQLAIIAEGCNYEFNKAEMQQIFAVLLRINIPKDHNTDDLTYGRQFYLREKYAALNAEAAKKERRGQKPITDRFKYFLGMLESDTFQPASY